MGKMKRTILFSTLIICLNVFSQNEIIYKCKDISQRDSISNDLKSKGYKKMNCVADGICIILKENNVFCFRSTIGENKDISKGEFYSNIIEVIKPTLNDYLSETDKFSGDKTYYGGGDIVSFMKVIGKKTSSQYVSITVKGSTLNYGCYGVSILFDNGKKIIRSKEKIGTKYSDSGWRYKAFFTPTLNEITLLKTQRVSAVKLYIYDADVNENESTTIIEDAKILLTTQKK